MVIANSNVNMTGSTTRTCRRSQTWQRFMKNAETGEVRLSEHKISDEFYDCMEDARDNTYRKDKHQSRDDERNSMAVQLAYTPLQLDSMKSLAMQLRDFLIHFRNRISLMIGSREAYEENGFRILDMSVDSGRVSVWRVTNYTEYTTYESETLNFATTGNVITGSGKSIEFNMELAMSREYVETTKTLDTGVEIVLMDPLVISLDADPIGVSDQKWRFDIDADGIMDEISMLSKGSGFLAFDKNKDGIINDGSELFGTKSGNGFLDLISYDLDNNGWIDENDAVYDELSVWAKDDSGEDKLIDLKTANVGAIYLGNVRTDYSLKSNKDNSHNAQIRRSGMYLSETGLARSIMQLDMVKKL